MLDEQAIAVVQSLSVEERGELKAQLRRDIARGYLAAASGDAEEVRGDVEATTAEALDAFDLPDSVLETNVGIPLIVVVTKADLVDSKAPENPLRRVSEEKLDALTRHLRVWCLKRGAALVYTSAALGTNCHALRRSLSWRSAGVKSRSTNAAEVAQRSALYIPCVRSARVVFLTTHSTARVMRSSPFRIGGSLPPPVARASSPLPSDALSPTSPAPRAPPQLRVGLAAAH